MWINLTKDQLEDIGAALRTVHEDDLLKEIERYVQNRFDPENEKWISAAQERYLSCGPTDGDIDIDSDAVVSDSDEGAYVMMWGWVRNSDVGLPDPEDEDDEDI